MDRIKESFDSLPIAACFFDSVHKTNPGCCCICFLLSHYVIFN